MQHTKYKCNCWRVGCPFCDGGLFNCTVCNGFEGTLTTDCPGIRMTEEQSNNVYAGQLDYRDGKGWVTPDGTGSSMGDMDIRYPRKIPF